MQNPKHTGTHRYKHSTLFGRLLLCLLTGFSHERDGCDTSQKDADLHHGFRQHTVHSVYNNNAVRMRRVSAPGAVCTCPVFPRSLC